MQNKEAIKVYNTNVEFIKKMLNRLNSHAQTKLSKNADSINWGDVGEIMRLSESLLEISDRVFKEGEYAE